MRIPFPLDLSIGTDIIAHNRILKTNASQRFLQRLASRFLHPRELSDLDKRFPNWRSFETFPITKQVKLRTHLAGRWAAKEAAKKAWGAHLISFKDLRIETLSGGEVQVVCQSFRETKTSSNDRDDNSALLEQTAKLSISHDGDYAVATVIAAPLHPDIMKDLQRRKDAAMAKPVLYELLRNTPEFRTIRVPKSGCPRTRFEAFRNELRLLIRKTTC